MTKIPVKTRLPLKAWLAAGLVTLFSLLSTVMHTPSNPDGRAANVAQATLTSAADNIITGAIR